MNKNTNRAVTWVYTIRKHGNTISRDFHGWRWKYGCATLAAPAKGRSPTTEPRGRLQKKEGPISEFPANVLVPGWYSKDTRSSLHVHVVVPVRSRAANKRRCRRLRANTVLKSRLVTVRITQLFVCTTGRRTRRFWTTVRQRLRYECVKHVLTCAVFAWIYITFI